MWGLCRGAVLGCGHLEPGGCSQYFLYLLSTFTLRPGEGFGILLSLTLDRPGHHIPMGLRHWYSRHRHACSLKTLSCFTDFPSFFGFPQVSACCPSQHDIKLCIYLLVFCLSASSVGNFYEGSDFFFLPCPLPCPQNLEECLTRSRCSLNIV